MDLTEVKENDFKDTAHDKRQKTQVLETYSRKKCKKTPNKSAGPSKNGENHISGRNFDFWKQSGIFKLEMQNPESDPFAYSSK